jgi:hypothetical protein
MMTRDDGAIILVRARHGREGTSEKRHIRHHKCGANEIAQASIIQASSKLSLCIGAA